MQESRKAQLHDVPSSGARVDYRTDYKKMQQIYIPSTVLRHAVMHAQSNAGREAGGMFVIKGDGRVAYRPGTNVHPEPEGNIELDAKWIYDMTVGGGCDPLAFFHSHPGGEKAPSAWDLESFPHWYVARSFIWYGVDYEMTMYEPALVETVKWDSLMGIHVPWRAE